MSDRDYYEILGLTPRADGAMVDQAYWHLARKYQLLAATNSRAQYLLDELNEAYGVLGNPNLRHQYDAFRDDVLVRRGMIKPVTSKPESRAARSAAERKSRSGRSLPKLRLQNWPTYVTSGVIVALAVAGAAQGVNLSFVILALVAGLAFALIPTVRSKVSDIHITMPSMPAISLPEMQAPKLTMPSMPAMPAMPEIGASQALKELGFGQAKDESVDADELRRSTAATIARWRSSVGLRAIQREDGDGPDMTLVDIVSGEQNLEQQDEPLAAVLDILRGASKQSISHQ